MQPILVLGEAGTGKTSAVITLPPEETIFISCNGRKELPWRGWKSQYVKRDQIAGTGNHWGVSDADKIVALLSAIDVNTNNKFSQFTNIIVDDFQYLMGFEYLERANEGGWDRFNDIAMHAFQVIDRLRNMERDFFIAVLAHSETIDIGGVKKEKIKTVGKLLDEKITVEGLFTTVLYSRCYRENNGKFNYYFETQNNGKNTARSPRDCFETFEIPNDLLFVKTKLIEYNG